MQELVPNPMRPHLQGAAEDILEGVKEGHIVGLGVLVILRRERFFVDALGIAARHPHLTRGALLSLDDYLRDISRSKRDTNTTR